MSDRIRQLEDALQQAHSQSSQTPHPLLSGELLQIKTSSELFGVGRDNANHASNGDNVRRAKNDDDDDGPSGSSVAPGDLEDPTVRLIPNSSLVVSRARLTGGPSYSFVCILFSSPVGD